MLCSELEEELTAVGGPLMVWSLTAHVFLTFMSDWVEELIAAPVSQTVIESLSLL